jgi:hypothetical protein
MPARCTLQHHRTAPSLCFASCPFVLSSRCSASLRPSLRCMVRWCDRGHRPRPLADPLRCCTLPRGLLLRPAHAGRAACSQSGTCSPTHQLTFWPVHSGRAASHPHAHKLGPVPPPACCPPARKHVQPLWCDGIPPPPAWFRASPLVVWQGTKVQIGTSSPPAAHQLTVWDPPPCRMGPRRCTGRCGTSGWRCWGC